MSDIEPHVTASRRKDRFKVQFSGWMIILPSIILFAFYIWVPLAETVRLSLYKVEGFDATQFVGLENFKWVFLDPDFMPAVINTFIYTFWSLIIGFLVPIFIAMFLNEVVHWKGLFRVSSYLPNMVPGLAGILMWSYIFGAGSTGIINIVSHDIFGVAPQNWLNNGALVIPVIVIIMTWKGAGATALIYLAGLQGINPELYEAAAIDGAGVWKRIRHITVPNIYNLGRTLLILQIISVFQILYEPLVLTNGGPADASISLMLLMYNYAFFKIDYASASAVSLIIAVFLLLLTMVYNLLVKRQDA
jgi:ABC-type sugar transport systems, permease components